MFLCREVINLILGSYSGDFMNEIFCFDKAALHVLLGASHIDEFPVFYGDEETFEPGESDYHKAIFGLQKEGFISLEAGKIKVQKDLCYVLRTIASSVRLISIGNAYTPRYVTYYDGHGMFIVCWSGRSDSEYFCISSMDEETFSDWIKDIDGLPMETDATLLHSKQENCPIEIVKDSWKKDEQELWNNPDVKLLIHSEYAVEFTQEQTEEAMKDSQILVADAGVWDVIYQSTAEEDKTDWYSSELLVQAVLQLIYQKEN